MDDKGVYSTCTIAFGITNVNRSSDKKLCVCALFRPNSAPAWHESGHDTGARCKQKTNAVRSKDGSIETIITSTKPQFGVANQSLSKAFQKGRGAPRR